MQIDDKPVALPKRARCAFDEEYAATPGVHRVRYSYTVGPSFTQSLVGFVDLEVDLKPDVAYVGRGAFLEPMTGSIRVERADSNEVVTPPKTAPLQEALQKNFPPLMAAMEDSCLIR